MYREPTSWFAGIYDDLCEEDEEYYRKKRAKEKFACLISTMSVEERAIVAASLATAIQARMTPPPSRGADAGNPS